MPESPLQAEVDVVSYAILVDGAEIQSSYQVVSISIAKAINRVSYAQIVLIDGNPADETFEISESKDFDPGKAIRIKIGYHTTDTDAFEGIITGQSIKVMSYAHKVISQLIITCHDKAIKMTLARNSANFQLKKDSDVISTLIQDHSLTAAVTATTFQHKALVQYNCTDWDFMLARSDANGMVVINDAGKVTVEKPSLSGTEVLSLNYGVDVINFNGEIDGLTQIKSAAFQSWDGTTLALLKGTGVEPTVSTHGDLSGIKLAEVGSSPEVAATTSAPEDKDVLKSWADANLQRSRLARIRGTVKFHGSTLAELGKLVSLAGFGAHFNGAAYISGVRHEVKEGVWTTEIEFGLSPRMFTDNGEHSGPQALGLLPAISGIHIGKVKKIDADPDGEYRIQVDLPMVEDSGNGVWARLGHPYASADVGFYFLPEVGDEVILGFLNSDPRFAVILGSLYGKKNKPAYTPESTNKDKAIITKSKMKITFNETDKIMVLETPGGNKVTLDDKAKTLKIEDGNKNSIEMASAGITLKSDGNISLVAKGKVEIKPTGNAEITATGDVTLKGNNVNAKANIALGVEGAASAELKASGTVTVKGAMVMIN